MIKPSELMISSGGLTLLCRTEAQGYTSFSLTVIT